jgi:hypothetical protein
MKNPKIAQKFYSPIFQALCFFCSKFFISIDFISHYLEINDSINDMIDDPGRDICESIMRQSSIRQCGALQSRSPAVLDAFSVVERAGISYG